MNAGAALLLAFLAFATPALALDGRVVGVADGDSITVLVGGREQVRVRLYGIDCPERGQAFGNQARAFTREALLGETVHVAEHGRDRYGRTLGTVTGPRGEVNSALVAAGLA